MEKIIIRSLVLVVSIVVIMGSTVVYGTIIPVAQQAKDNAVAPGFSPVIEILEETNEDGMKGGWLLTPSPQNTSEPTIPFEDGKLLSLPDKARDNGLAPAHSPVIDIEGEDNNWILTPLSNSGNPGGEALYVPLELNLEVTEVFSTALTQKQVTLTDTGISQGSGITVVPEPATICLLGFGGLTLLRKRRA